MAEQLSSIDQLITRFIFDKPEVVVQYLQSSGYKVPSPVTLPVIIEKTFTAIYSDKNQQFIKLLGDGMQKADYHNFIMAVAALAVSLTGIISSAAQAKKARKLQAQIALANLTVNKELAETQIRTQAETDRTNILLNTLYQYRTDLQSQSTQRLRDVWVYSGIMAAGVSLLYGTYVLLKNS